MARKDDQDRERREREQFAKQSSEDAHRTWLSELYPLWHGWSERFFSCRLKPPHIGFGRTAPRSLGHCAATTDYGAPLQLLLNEALVFGTNLDWIVNPRGKGHRLFVSDLLLRLTVQQYVLEHLGTDEASYRGYGPLFTEHANRVGLHLGIAQVIVRRQGPEDDKQPVASGWPFCGRDADYYGDDVTEDLRKFASGIAAPRSSRHPLPPSLGVWEMVMFYLAVNRTGDLRQMAAAQIDRLKATSRSAPVLAKFEKGEEDENGQPIVGEVSFDPRWLEWNGGTVKTLAQAIHDFRAYTELPILADALDEAGCDDGRILRHLRARTKGHDSRCWVIRQLLAC